MRIFPILAVVLFVGVMPAHAQSDQASGPVVPDRSYKLLREDEDWSFLRDPALRRDFWDPINYIPLRRSSDDWYLTMGGEAREVWEQTGNNNWGQQPYWNSFFLERYSAAVIGFTTGDCQNTRKTHKATRIVGWVVGWKNGPDVAFLILCIAANRVRFKTYTSSIPPRNPRLGLAAMP